MNKEAQTASGSGDSETDQEQGDTPVQLADAEMEQIQGGAGRPATNWAGGSGGWTPSPNTPPRTPPGG